MHRGNQQAGRGRGKGQRKQTKTVAQLHTNLWTDSSPGLPYFSKAASRSSASYGMAGLQVEVRGRVHGGQALGVKKGSRSATCRQMPVVQQSTVDLRSPGHLLVVLVEAIDVAVAGHENDLNLILVGKILVANRKQGCKLAARACTGRMLPTREELCVIQNRSG